MNVSDKVKICCVGERENERVNEWNEMAVYLIQSKYIIKDID